MQQSTIIIQYIFYNAQRFAIYFQNKLKNSLLCWAHTENDNIGKFHEALCTSLICII